MYFLENKNNSAPLVVLRKLFDLLRDQGYSIEKWSWKCLFCNNIIFTTGIKQDLIGFLLKHIFRYKWISIIQCIPTRDLRSRNKNPYIFIWLYLLRRSNLNLSLSKSHKYALDLLKITSEYIYVNNLLKKNGPYFSSNKFDPINIVFIGNSNKRVDFLKPLANKYNVCLFGLDKHCGIKNYKSFGWHDNPWEKILPNSIIVNPSLTEAYPLIMNEALSLGYPYVCTNLIIYKEFRKISNIYLFRKNSLENLLHVIGKVDFNNLQIINNTNYNIDALLNFIDNYDSNNR